MYMRTSFAAARTLGRDSFIMNMDDYSIGCFNHIIIYHMFPANNFGDSFARNLRFAIFAINFFGHFKYLYFSTLSYKKVFKYRYLKCSKKLIAKIANLRFPAKLSPK